MGPESAICDTLPTNQCLSMSYIYVKSQDLLQTLASHIYLLEFLGGEPPLILVWGKEGPHFLFVEFQGGEPPLILLFFGGFLKAETQKNKRT